MNDETSIGIEVTTRGMNLDPTMETEMNVFDGKAKLYARSVGYPGNSARTCKK